MIVSFACDETEKIWDGLRSRHFPPDIQDRALRKLRMIDAAQVLNDLRIPPSNHLEALQGKRGGQMSIRINAQWRICFSWHGNEAHDVEIVDYH